jgi:hypothetical protein
VIGLHGCRKAIEHADPLGLEGVEELAERRVLATDARDILQRDVRKSSVYVGVYS